MNRLSFLKRVGAAIAGTILAAPVVRALPSVPSAPRFRRENWGSLDLWLPITLRKGEYITNSRITLHGKATVTVADGGMFYGNIVKTAKDYEHKADATLLYYQEGGRGDRNIIIGGGPDL